MLYELLTGTTPFDAATLRKASYAELQRVIREEEPPKPSLRLDTLSATPQGASIARLRGTEPAALARLARGDLNWIAMKAMEKDRTRRYATAKDLADDIERHLSHEPVLAGPPSVVYRTSKFIRRHRVGVLASTIVFLAVVIGFAFATTGLIEARRARASEHGQRALAESNAEAARDEALKAATISRFLEEMLRSVDPSQMQGRAVTVRFVLDEATRKIGDGALAAQPEVEAAVRITLGETYEALGLYTAAEEHLRAAHSMWQQLHGDDHPDTLRASHALAELFRIEGKFSQAEALLRATAEAQCQVLGEEHPDTLATMNELALALCGPGRFTEAEGIHRRTLEIRRRVLGEQHIDTVRSMEHLGSVCRAVGKFAEAGTLLRRALELSQHVFGPEHPCTAEVLNNLGMLLEDQREYEQAETLYRQTYEIDRRVLGPDHPRTLIPMNNLLRVLHVQAKTDETRPLVEERIAGLRRGTERPDAHALAFHAYAWELLNCQPADLRDPAAALPVAMRAVELDGGQDAGMLETLALAFRRTGDVNRAIETQRRAIARAKIGGPYNQAELESRLVEYLLAKGDVVGAASASWEELAGRLGDKLLPDTSPGASLVDRSETLIAERRFEEAAELLRGCLAVRQKSLPEDHWLIGDTMVRLGGAIAGQGEFVEAESLLVEGYAELTGARQAPAERKTHAIRQIIDMYESWGRPDEATQWRQRLNETPGSIPG